ncbi:hypothetical protein ABE957_11550 [Halomonas sp. CS7]|uniref:Uncharacterized protein n=1 Tax=Halomonas pelophila TaxID=3151122 RepID=A0ABV1N6E7_9GAMM
MAKSSLYRLKSNELHSALKKRCVALQAIELASFFALGVVQVADLAAVSVGMSGGVDCAVGAPLAMLVGLLQSSSRSRQEQHGKRKTENNTMR